MLNDNSLLTFQMSMSVARRSHVELELSAGTSTVHLTAPAFWGTVSMVECSPSILPQTEFPAEVKLADSYVYSNSIGAKPNAH